MLHGRMSDFQGLPEMAPTSPSQASIDMDQGQHMPHLLCACHIRFRLIDSN